MRLLFVCTHTRTTTYPQLFKTASRSMPLPTFQCSSCFKVCCLQFWINCLNSMTMCWNWRNYGGSCFSLKTVNSKPTVEQHEPGSVALHQHLLAPTRNDRTRGTWGEELVSYRPVEQPALAKAYVTSQHAQLCGKLHVRGPTSGSAESNIFRIGKRNAS